MDPSSKRCGHRSNACGPGVCRACKERSRTLSKHGQPYRLVAEPPRRVLMDKPWSPVARRLMEAVK